MTFLPKRLVSSAFLLLLSTAVLGNSGGVIQAKLAYMDLLAGNVKTAYQRIPVPSAVASAASQDADSTEEQPTLAFARQMRLYGQNKLAIEALEHYTEGGISTEFANQYWLEFGEYFLDSGSIASADYCFNIIREPLEKSIRPRYYRLKASVLLNKLDTEGVEYILKKKWKGRHAKKPYTRLNLATTYLDKGDFAAAHASIEKLVKDFPKKVEADELATLLDTANLRIGFAHLTSGNLDEAKAYLIKIPLDSLYAPRATLGLAWVELGKGHEQEALAPLAHLIETTANHQQEKQEAYSLLPVVASQQKKYGKAANLYQQSQAIYLAERDAVKRYSISVYSGKAINQLTKDLMSNGNGEFNITSAQQILGKPLYSYLFNLLEKDTTKSLFSAYYQQVLLLQDLNTWHKKGLLKAESFQRLSQLMKNSTFKHKDQLIRVLASEIETHIARLEKMAAHAEFSAGTMFEKAGAQH